MSTKYRQDVSSPVIHVIRWLFVIVLLSTLSVKHLFHFLVSTTVGNVI
jgi:hypothetical protein